MNIADFCAGLVSHFYGWNTVCPYPIEPKRFISVLDSIHGMTTPSTMELLNFAVSCMEGDECYLEVGTWRGATLIGALLDNQVHGYAIDNGDGEMRKHSGDGKRDKVVWAENIAQYGLASRTTYIEGETPGIWETALDLPPVGVFFYDGDKRTPDVALEGIVGALPLLATQSLIICDDLNEPPIREALWVIRRKYPRNLIPLMDIPTPANCWPCFWNGISVSVWVTE